MAASQSTDYSSFSDEAWRPNGWEWPEDSVLTITVPVLKAMMMKADRSVKTGEGLRTALISVGLRQQRSLTFYGVYKNNILLFHPGFRPSQS